MPNGNNNSNGNGKRRRAKQKNKRSSNGNGNNCNIMSGSSMPRNNAPLMGMSAFERSGRNSFTHLSGRDFVSRLTVKPSTAIIDPQDQILIRQPISVSSFPGTRLTALSNLWERYRWSQAILEYVPAVPNTIACQLVAYIDTDPQDDLAGVKIPDDLVRQAVAQVGSRQWNFNQRMDIPLIVRKDDQLYYTGEDKQNPRFSLQGVLYIIQVTNLIDFNGSTLTNPLVAGSLYVRWGVHFSMPQINPEALPTTVSEIRLKYVKKVTGNTSTLLITNLEPEQDYVLSIGEYTNSYNVPDGIAAASTKTLGDPNANTIATVAQSAVYESAETQHVATVSLTTVPEQFVRRTDITGSILLTNPQLAEFTVLVYTFEVIE